MTSAAATDNGQNLRWYQGLDRYCWVVLFIAALGWLFDTMDQNIFNLVRKPSLEDLIRTTQHLEGPALIAAVNEASGVLTSVFLIGWAVGGFVFGILGDKLGRTGTMILTILIYAVFTGLSGLSWDVNSYGFMRFMTALGVGGEWAAGAAIVAEVFPARSRPMALGTLQALSAVGNMMAAGITFGLGNMTEQWRTAYFIGALPALLVLWIRKTVREPEKWKHARESSAAEEFGNIAQLFSIPHLRRNTIAATLMAAAGVGALWGVGFFSADLMHTELKEAFPDNSVRGKMVSTVFFLQQVGAFIGLYTFAVVSERLNRKKAFYLWWVLAWISIPLFFWGVANSGSAAYQRGLLLAPILGFCSLGPFAGYSIYFPELFPTRLRATGLGFCYNAARILAAFAPFTLGKLSSVFATQGGTVATSGGLPMAATVVTSIYIFGFIGTALGPETKGTELPE